MYRTIYLYYPYDGGEGYNRSLRAAFDNKEDIEKLVETDAHCTIREVTVYDNLNEFLNMTREKLVASAMLKLSKAEIEALGLTPR